MIPLQTVQLVCGKKAKRMPSKVDIWLTQTLEPNEDSMGDLHDVFSSSDQTFSLIDYLNDAYETTESTKSITSFEQNNIMLYDCMWTGCDEKCRSKHNSEVMDCDDNLDVLPGRLSCSSFDFEDRSQGDTGAAVTNSARFVPYTPDNDHCYSQPKHLQAPEESYNNRISTDSIYSDTGTDSSDDEVDVVTVSDECGFLAGRRYVPQIRRTAPPQQQPRKVRKQTVKSRNTSHIERTVKAAASALKRTKYQSRINNVKRRKTMNSVETSPSSSLPSSCGSSRCSSDVEDYEKRHTHNDSERKRREAQRSALQMLRLVIPDLKDNSKAPKVLILNAASKLVRQLESEEDKKLAIRKKELKRRKKLQSRLLALKQSRNIY